MRQKFRWHHAAKIQRDGLCITRGDVEASLDPAWSKPGKRFVRYIPDNQGKRILYQSIFNSIQFNSEFCLVEDSATAALLAKTDSAAIIKSEQIPRTGKDLPVFQCMSSGSSGEPKRIRRTHRSWIQCFEANARLWSLGGSDTFAILGKLSHSLSLYGALEALHLGALLIDLAEQRPDAQLAELGRRQASILYATPSQIKLLLKRRKSKPIAPVQTLRKVFVGGSKLDQRTAAACQSIFPKADVHQFYGASETSFIAMSTRETPAESTGKAFPGVDIEIRTCAGEPLGPGKTGAIWVKSPYLFEGYASDKPGSAEWSAGWISVGEIGWLDLEGNLFIKGRKDRVVQIADKSIQPEPIEEYLAGLPGIENSAVVPINDATRGHSLVAFVAVQPEHELDIPAMLSACRGHFGTSISPRKIVALPEWPLLHSGKTDYAAIQAMAEE